MRIRHYTYGPSARSGFTLIELLVVIGIIGLLIGITLVIGGGVMNGSRKSATLNTIQVLDSALEAYIKSTDGSPPPTAVGLDTLTPNNIFLGADARDMATGFMNNSIAVFMFQAAKVPDAKGVLDRLPPKFVKRYDGDDPAGGTTPPQPFVMTVFDGWMQPIRYVHPAFQGDVIGDIATPNPATTAARPTDQVVGAAPVGQTYAMANIRRNHVVTTTAADSDGGVCPSTRPYFYSAGQDGLVGWLMDASGNTIVTNNNTDNVYTTVPKLPAPK
jgi:prepilin-type N-terminal cleavage/methylation domain-containing protein